MAEPISRREFLKVAAVAATAGAGAALVAGGSLADPGEKSESESTPSPQPKPTEALSPPKSEVISETTEDRDLIGLTTEGMKYKDVIIENADAFMALPPEDPYNDSGDKTREEKESQLMGFLETSGNASAADIILAIQACATIMGRGWGMELLWKMRQEGKLEKHNINPLSQEKIDWAVNWNDRYPNYSQAGYKIDPRTLAIAEDAWYPAYQLLKAGKDFFLQSAPEKDTFPIARRMPPPGLMAELMTWETKSPTKLFDPNSPVDSLFGHVYIGSHKAVEQYNTGEGWFPTGPSDLKAIAEYMEEITGLPFGKNWENIPGSHWPDGSKAAGTGSGGAIGSQFMPIYAKRFMEWYNQANELIDKRYPPASIFDPFRATIMAYLYLAADHPALQGYIDENNQPYVREGGRKPGYRAGYPNEVWSAIYKWNMVGAQIDSSITAGQDYINIFWRDTDPRDKLG